MEKVSKAEAGRLAQSVVIFIDEELPRRRRPGQRSVRAAVRRLLPTLGFPDSGEEITAKDVPVGRKRADLLFTNADDGFIVYANAPNSSDSSAAEEGAEEE